jgi:tetratricopeptide (TPR) repeat protein
LANPTGRRAGCSTSICWHALATIGRDLPDQPLVARRIAAGDLNAYTALGRHDAALRVADDAIARFQSGLGALDVKTLRARYARAQVIKQLGRSRADLPALEQLIEDAKIAGPAARAQLLQAQLLHAEVQGTEGGQLAQSVARVRELVAQHADHFGADAEPTIRATQILAMLIGRAGDLAAATPLWRRTLAQLQASKGVEDASTISAMDMLGANLALQGNNEEALPLHLRALELRRKLHGTSTR